MEIQLSCIQTLLLFFFLTSFLFHFKVFASTLLGALHMLKPALFRVEYYTTQMWTRRELQRYDQSIMYK